MKKQKKDLLLEYLNLNLKKLPRCIKSESGVDIRASEIQNEKNYKIYKYLKISDINILLTNARRLDEPAKKIENMSLLSYYFDKKNEDEYSIILDILQNASIENIEEISMEQERFSKNIPSKIKYTKDYLWQIYYVKRTNKYYMIVPLQETEQQTFLYILKKQIEDSKEKIYVPICNMDYENDYIEKAKINELENCLYYFTKKWPMLSEIYSKNNKLAVCAIGELEIYENISSDYKLYFKNKGEINDFYSLIKTLFYLQTELSNYLKFEIILDEEGRINFYYKGNKLTASNLNEFYADEIKQALKEIKEIERIQKELNIELKNLKSQEKVLNADLLNKQKQISTFLECKKTFFGRVKYFFKYNNKYNKKKKENAEDSIIEDTTMESIENFKIPNSDDIENLISICKDLIAITTLATTTKLDIQNITKKIEILKKKIENATCYIQEIESHKKSIFEFWKFTNKDEANQLNEGIIKREDETKIKTNFNIKEDLPEFAKNIDLVQRNKLTDREQNSILVASSKIIKDINTIIAYKQITSKELQAIKQASNLIEINEETLTHRESARKIKSIIKISENTSLEEYTLILNKIFKNIESALRKITLNINLPVYTLSKPKKELTKFEINPSKLISENKTINLYRMNLNSGIPFIAFSNIIFFNNRNKTLPLGMDYSTEVLINLEKYEINEKDKKSNYIIKLKDNTSGKQVTKINISEFDI